MPSIVPPTKGEVRWRAVAYVLVMLVGVFVMLDRTGESAGVKSVLGFWPALVWSGFLGTALVAALATLRGRWRVEYVLMPLFGIALGVAVLAGCWGVGAGVLEGVIDWQKAARLASAAALLALLIARYSNLRRLVRAVKAHEPWTQL